MSTQAEIPKSRIFDSVEKLFRYFIPGVIFWVLYGLSYPSNFKSLLTAINDVQVFGYLAVLATGMVVYGAYRTVLYCVEIIFYIFNWTPSAAYKKKSKRWWNLIDWWDKYSSAMAKFYIFRQSDKLGDKLPDYLHLRWSISHYAMTFSLLALYFLLFHEQASKLELWPWIIIPGFLFCLSGITIITLFRIEKKIVEEKEDRYTIKRQSCKKVLFVPSEDGFGPSALLSYIVKAVLSAKPHWNVIIWNKARFNYNEALYLEDNTGEKVIVEPVWNLIELVKGSGKVSIPDTLRKIGNYANKSCNYPNLPEYPFFDIVVDFGVPAAARWAKERGMHSLSVFDHSWSKTFEMILDEYIDSCASMPWLKKRHWAKIIKSLIKDEKYVTELYLFPEFISPQIYFKHWTSITSKPIRRIDGVLGGTPAYSRSEVEHQYSLPKSKATVLVQGGDTSAWDDILTKILPLIAEEDEKKLKEKELNVIVYVPERLMNNPSIKKLENKQFKRFRIINNLKGSTIQELLPAVDLIITRAGGGTVNDAVACRIPFVCIEEPTQSQVTSILNACLSKGLTRIVAETELLHDPVDLIVKNLELESENREIVERMEVIPNRQEVKLAKKIIDRVEKI